MKNSVERFSDRVENYTKYRPSYPPQMLEVFRDEMGLGAGSVVADVGSGTGISSKAFLDLGCTVYGVEPNAAMRSAAEEFLSGYEKFESVDGTAEETGLPSGSADVAAAAQAFHWFDPEKTHIEFKRILKPGGYAALIWNERRLDADEFHREYESLLLKYGNDYERVRHENITAELLSQFFNSDFEHRSIVNKQVLSIEGMIGRVLSSSYMPAGNDPRIEAMNEELRALFAKHAERDRIEILYDTNIFFTQL